MEIRQLSTFRVVAQTLSFSRTAASLNYAQSTVSAQIQALEEGLGVSLFDRLGKHVALTEAGQQLMTYADKILDLAAEAQSVVSNSDAMTGTVTICAPGTLCAYRLPLLLREFRAHYPDVQLMIPSESDPNLMQSMREGSVDIAFAMGEPVQNPQLTIETLIQEPLVIAADPMHPLAKLACVDFADLQDVSMILTERTCGYRKIFEAAVSAAGVHPKHAMEFYNVEAIKQCVMAGIGVTFLPLVAIQPEIDAGKLVPLRWVGPEFHVVTQMMWHKDKWLSPVLSAFIEAAREILNNG